MCSLLKGFSALKGPDDFVIHSPIPHFSPKQLRVLHQQKQNTSCKFICMAKLSAELLIYYEDIMQQYDAVKHAELTNHTSELSENQAVSLFCLLSIELCDKNSMLGSQNGP